MINLSSPLCRALQVDYKIVHEFSHSELASDPDNQNKSKVCVYVGLDSKGNKLYDLHERRVRNGNLNHLLCVFQKSEMGARFREATKTPQRPRGAVMGRRQFAKALCPCIKKRKSSQCDCQLCTYVTDNLVRWNKARQGWHTGRRERIGGTRCKCHIHAPREPSAEEEEEESAWHAAAAADAEPSEELCERWFVATAKGQRIRSLRQRAATYDTMTTSTEKLTAALLCCGRQTYPDYSVTGTTFCEYDQACAASNCPKQLFASTQACGWDRVFGADCPIECSNEPFEWYIWSQQQRGKDEEGKPTYSPEWTPHRGTRAEFLKEYRSHVREWLYHSWRDRFLRQSLRVFDDRRSGRHVVALRNRVLAGPGAVLLANALRVVADYAALQLQIARDAGVHPGTSMHLHAGTLAAIARVAETAAASYRPREEETAALSRAEKQFYALRNTAVVQCDYAAQFESERERTATCARMERHNFEVSHVGFGPYVEVRRKGRFRHNKSPRERTQYKQNVYVFFSFFNAGYKPNARSHNVVQEDIDHFLKYGTFLYGEWFEGGSRYPGGPTGDGRLPLPDTLKEAPQVAPVLPGYDRRVEITDGCACQYDGGTQHHQTAEWRTKTASWPEAQQAAETAAAQAATARTVTEAAAARARKVVAESGIVRVHVKKVESHGKAGATDGEGNVPTFAIRAGIESGALLHPGTRELVLYLADQRRTPSVAKSAKDGWQAATKYFMGYFDTSLFTKRSVPDCEARGWGCHEQHVYIGLCADRQRAERDGPLRTGKMFCSCVPCSMLDFERCEMMTQMGRTRYVQVPLPTGTASRVPQITSLQVWADMLKPGMVAAVRATGAEHHIEGPIWLFLVDSEAFEVPDDMVHSTAEFEAGWLVVRGRWYELVQRSPRGYKLLPASRLCVVNTMIRLPNIVFSGGAIGKAPRTPRSGLHVLEEDTWNLLLESA